VIVGCCEQRVLVTHAPLFHVQSFDASESLVTDASPSTVNPRSLHGLVVHCVTRNLLSKLTFKLRYKSTRRRSTVIFGDRI